MISSRKSNCKTLFLFGVLSFFFACNQLLHAKQETQITDDQINILDHTELADTCACQTCNDKQETREHGTESSPTDTIYENQMPTETQETIDDIKDYKAHIYGPKIIDKIIVSGNRFVDTDAILTKVPYAVGERFDQTKTRKLIHNLYYGIKRFRNIKIFAEPVDATKINLHIAVEEKAGLKEVKFFPEKRKISDKQIKEKTSLTDKPAIDPEELERIAKEIKNLYIAKNFHHVNITPEMQLDEVGKAVATFTIDEGDKSLVKRVNFVGNEHISDKELRKVIFTREDWILGFLDNAGSLQPDRLDADTHIIEQYYQSNGFLTAKVLKADVHLDEQTKHFTITFHIEEGDIYTVKEVKASGNDILKDDYLLSRISIRPGDLYSREKIVEAIKDLEFIWGELGYIYTHINPSIQPDEEEKTVIIAFDAEIGNQVRLNKINIVGNRKTRDKVIRRKLMLREGDILTNRKMEMSKYAVDSLGYFDPADGVEWKTTRLEDNMADLDLILKEVRSGHAGIKFGFGGSVQSLQAANSSFSVSAEITDRNLFGSGMALALNASLAKGEQSLIFNITNPWMFDRPITGALDIYHKRPSYGEFRNLRPVTERLTGGGVTVGFVAPRLYTSQVLFRLGVDSVRYERKPVAYLPIEKATFTEEYQKVLNCLFEPGNYLWLETHIGRDMRNHPMMTSRGYQWLSTFKFGVPSLDCNIGYFKWDIDFNWFTPLIGERDLVFKFHTYLGLVVPFKNRYIPYRELFHIGGPASVRGFLFGQVGPQFCGDSIGAKKAFFVNAELRFPVTQDFNIKGVVFYDGGTGWDNPYAHCITSCNMINNSFNFRHSVGFGIRLMKPAPVRIDWGFKLDRRKKLGETASEVHFGMSYDW